MTSNPRSPRRAAAENHHSRHDPDGAAGIIETNAVSPPESLVRRMMRTADQIFEDSFLETRAKLIEVAANLDRIDRAVGDVQDQADGLSAKSLQSRDRIDEAIQICLSDTPDRAKQLQQLFSRPYASDWRSTMQL